MLQLLDAPRSLLIILPGGGVFSNETSTDWKQPLNSVPFNGVRKVV